MTDLKKLHIALDRIEDRHTKRAHELLTSMGGHSSQWRNARLAGHALPVFSADHRDGREPAYLEFKVVAPGVDGAGTDRGWIHVSTTPADFPLAGYAEEGPTPVEALAAKAGGKPFRPMRYGSTYLVAEGVDGQVVAERGTRPAKPVGPWLEVGRRGVSCTGTEDSGKGEPIGGPKIGAEGYRDYAELRRDFLENPVYQHMRTRQRRMARGQWAVIDRPPTITRVNIGHETVILPDESISHFHFDAGDGAEPIAVVTRGQNGTGLHLTGKLPGGGRLDVETPSGSHSIGVMVLGKGFDVPVTFQPGWTDWSKWFAGANADAPKYAQITDEDFCPDVGCGPNAWLLYFAWFERLRGVTGAFGKPGVVEAPPDSEGDEHRAQLLPAARELHDLCDVMCFATSDQGATPPVDMMEAFTGYTWIRQELGWIKRSFDMHWTLDDDCPEDGAWRCRNAIKKGYPAVVGLGWLWHYALAYGYMERDYMIAPNIPYLTERRLKCNMGHGFNPPEWFDLCGTFWSSDNKLVNGKAVP